MYPAQEQIIIDYIYKLVVRWQKLTVINRRNSNLRHSDALHNRQAEEVLSELVDMGESMRENPEYYRAPLAVLADELRDIMPTAADFLNRA